MYTPREVGKRIHVSVKTLQRWDRQGVLRAHRTPTNRRYYTTADLESILPQAARAGRRTVAYSRVSSVAQKPDLENQHRLLEAFCTARGFVVDEWISEIGGGLNFKRKQFLRLVDAVIAGEVSTLVIAHKDRLARFGYSLLAHLCETHECKDRKSTRLNSSHANISYAVFCLKKKNKNKYNLERPYN